jgi:uncharacterized membrane protein YbaN (DUF454 family)
VIKKNKKIWLVFGWIFAALALVGVVLPIVPQIPFAVLAAFFFSKGSARLHRWILNNKHFGAPVRDWEMDQVVRKKTKVASITMMIVGATLAFFKLREDHPTLAIVIPVLFFGAIIFVATRRSKSRMTDDSRDAYRPPIKV